MRALPLPLLTRGVLLAAALASAAVVVYLAGDSSTGPVAVAAFALWVASPYVLLWVATPRWITGTGPTAVALAAAAGLAAFGGWAYYQGFVAQPDAQSGLLFLIVPGMQWIAAIAATAIGVVWSAAAGARPDRPGV